MKVVKPVYKVNYLASSEEEAEVYTLNDLKSIVSDL
jgi:hypothetical protein